MSKLDQGLLDAVTTLAQLAAHYNLELIKEGFTAKQAMELTKDFIDAQIRPQQNNTGNLKPSALFSFQQ